MATTIYITDQGQTYSIRCWELDKVEIVRIGRVSRRNVAQGRVFPVDIDHTTVHIPLHNVHSILHSQCQENIKGGIFRKEIRT